MDKMKRLLAKIGASDALQKQICEELDRFMQETKSKYDTKYKQKLANVKKVFNEESGRYKATLAKKVEVYLESKEKSINDTIQRQRAHDNTEATNLLKQVKSLTEGMDIGTGDNRKVVALEKTVGRMQKAVNTMADERNAAIVQANRSNSIATRLAQHCSLLETKLVDTGILSEADVLDLTGDGMDTSIVGSKGVMDRKSKEVSGRDSSGTPTSGSSSEDGCKKCECDPCECETVSEGKDCDCESGKCCNDCCTGDSCGACSDGDDTIGDDSSQGTKKGSCGSCGKPNFLCKNKCGSKDVKESKKARKSINEGRKLGKRTISESPKTTRGGNQSVNKPKYNDVDEIASLME